MGTCVTPPPNDNRSSAHPITLSTGEVTVTGTTVGATFDGPMPSMPCGCAVGPNVWYSITVTQREVLYIDTAGTGFDTTLTATDSVGTFIGCNDNADCTTEGFTALTQSWIFGAVLAGTYDLAVGGCTQGAFTLHVQHLPSSLGSNFIDEPLTGTGTTPMATLGGVSAQTSLSCGGSASGEDVRWFATCGGQPQLFSLCSADGATFTRAIGAISFDPAMYLRSGLTGNEATCDDDAPGCTGTGGDLNQWGSRLSDVGVGRGIHAVFVDERTGGPGMMYTLHYVIR